MKKTETSLERVDDGRNPNPQKTKFSYGKGETSCHSQMSIQLSLSSYTYINFKNKIEDDISSGSVED